MFSYLTCCSRDWRREFIQVFIVESKTKPERIEYGFNLLPNLPLISLCSLFNPIVLFSPRAGGCISVRVPLTSAATGIPDEHFLQFF